MSEPLFEAEWNQARECVLNAARLATRSDVALPQAHGRVLAQDITALADMPPFHASRIDGWAVAGPGPWTVVGDSRAGMISVIELNSGECLHIATGAALPTGTTACLKDEESACSDDNIVTAVLGAAGLLNSEGALPDGHDIRPAGYEARAGEILISRGTRLTPALVGVIAGAGHNTVTVFDQVTVDIVIFGDELLDEGPSRDGKVRDSLGPQLPLWLDTLGARTLNVTRVEDTLEAHVAAIAASRADLIITTGGTAAGPVDHLHQAIVECDGELLIDAVLVRPGYHQLFASLPQRHLIGLPGNPQSAVIGLLSLADTFIRGCYGQGLRPLAQRTITQAAKAPQRELKFVLCRETVAGVEPVEHVDSSMLRGFVEADGYALVPAGGVAAGTHVQWLPLP